MSDWNLLDPDIIEWRAFGPQRDDQRRELSELRWTIEPLAARLAAGHGREEVQQRLGDMVEIMGHAMGQGDSLTFSRADAEFHSLLIQVAGNRMLEHLSGSSRPPPGLRRTGDGLRAPERRGPDAARPHRRRARRGRRGGRRERDASIAHGPPEVERVVPAPRSTDRNRAGGATGRGCPSCSTGPCGPQPRSAVHPPSDSVGSSRDPAESDGDGRRRRFRRAAASPTTRSRSWVSAPPQAPVSMGGFGCDGALLPGGWPPGRQQLNISARIWTFLSGYGV